ncbi:MAG: 5-(carboxyamino)imidazole ribonucleotide synthase [Burkholderiales bacterium]|nr:5-(carboxyamino)imidazole ribonucleotide synthase [Burkholderiales bacterium]
MVSPGATLAVLGGGQLGRMFVHAAQALGYRTLVLEPDAGAPAGAAADVHLRAAYDDAQALADLARRAAAVTTEFENVPAAVLRRLADGELSEGTRVVVAPPADAVQVCQHRVLEKALFVRAGVPCAPHAAIECDADLGAAALDALLPGLLKTSRLGYDGKGQAAVATRAELAAAWRHFGGVPCVLERRLALAHELSVIVARGGDGRCVHLPVQQNLHRDGILALTQVPAPDIDVATAASAIAAAERLAAALSYVGVLCVEFFVLADGSLVANEMAPRPHNSGHYSIDACDLSQFELQVRTLAGLPLVAPRLHSAAVMINLLGDLWFAPGAATPREPDWPAVLALPGTHLHLYGKTEARHGRKMGHLTITAADAAGARAVALEAAARLGLPGP